MNDTIFLGARRHTQPLDIAHGIALAIEKGMDRRSQGAAAGSPGRARKAHCLP